MVRDAEQTALAAAADDYNTPGYCLQWCRQKADIPALYGTASLAWMNVQDKHKDRNPPRGAMVYWTGGSRGYGHIAVSLGGGLIRSTDAGGSGRVATRTLAWFDTNWSSLPYAGWAPEVNGVTIPGVIETKDWFDMADKADLHEAVKAEINDPEFIEKVAQAAQRAVWDREMSVDNLQGETVKKEVSRLVRDIWEKTRSIVKS